MSILKKLLYLISIFVFVISIVGCSNIGPENDTEYKRIEVELVQSYDGDTIAVIYNGSRESVRFLLVDSPETSHPRLGEQPYGKEAKEFTRSLVENAHKIELEFDIGPQRDKYDRLLAYVYVDGKMIQEELLKMGLARVAYVYPPNTRYFDQFNEYQKIAQRQGIGIWEIENYVQKDGFHAEFGEVKDTKDGEPEECQIKGNIGSVGKIYHTPNSPWYEQTKPEVMFCTEEEAVKAGFRPPKK